MKVPGLLIAVVLLAPGSPLVAYAQEGEGPLSSLAHLTGVDWVGRLDDVELTKRLEPMLGGRAIRETTIAPALGYTDETIFYWDLDRREIGLFKLTSRGHVIRGTVTTEDGLVIQEGEAVRPDGVSRFRRTFELTTEGRLIDIYYNSEGAEWVRAHYIEYEKRRPD